MQARNRCGRGPMKPSLIKILAALIVVVVVGGCSTVRQETAIEWMQKQPNYIDP
jgi:hypothetical protein